jgi:hypothetical protein
MDAEEIRSTFEAAISEAVSSAGAKLDTETKAKLFQKAEIAAYEIVRNISEWEEDRMEMAVGEGVNFYKKLVADMVRFSKLAGMFPNLNKHVLGGTPTARDVVPPYWYPD